MGLPVEAVIAFSVAIGVFCLSFICIFCRYVTTRDKDRITLQSEANDVGFVDVDAGGAGGVSAC